VAVKIMLKLTRITGEEILVNLDLIELVERHSDTVISLNNGNKIIVKETLDELMSKLIEFNRAIIKTYDDKKQQ
jgi:flagellar protein FlbD